MSDKPHDDFAEGHTGPIKTPKQMLWTSIFAFVAPVFIIIGLVNLVTSQNKPAAGAVDVEKAVATRIAKVGSVVVRDPNRAPDSGEAVFKGQCVSCHGGNGPGPNLGDAAAWGPRIGTGLQALIGSSLKGKGGMQAQGGGDYSDHEIARAVVYMANAAGAKFEDPSAPGAATAAATGTTPVADDAAVKAAAAPAKAGSGAGEALYNTACVTCHASGAGGAPILGDKAAWAPRVGQGVDALTATVIKGKGVMPARGMATAASDAEIKASVQYMLTTVQ